jgi:hypothetical protein
MNEFPFSQWRKKSKFHPFTVYYGFILHVFFRPIFIPYDLATLVTAYHIQPRRGWGWGDEKKISLVLKLDPIFIPLKIFNYLAPLGT